MNKFTKLGLFTLLLATVIFSSCKKEYDSIESVDDAAIQAYLKKNNLNYSKDASGYYYSVPVNSPGTALKYSDSVFYSYTFKTLSGQVLNQTSDLMIPGTYLGYTSSFTIGSTPYAFTPISDVLLKLKRGEKGTVIIPSNMAFGKNGLSTLNIGSNENIIVDLGIYSFTKKHEVDEFEINKFIADNKLTMTKDPSRARYNIITPGTGADVITTNSTIVANYTVRYLDGTQLETSADGGFSSVLNALYKGWQIVLPGRVTAGGKLRLIIPTDLAGGTTPLDFDIEIVSVTN